MELKRTPREVLVYLAVIERDKYWEAKLLRLKKEIKNMEVYDGNWAGEKGVVPKKISAFKDGYNEALKHVLKVVNEAFSK